MYGAAPGDDLVGGRAASAADSVRGVEGAGGRGAVRDGDQDFAPVSMRNATAYGASPRLRLDIVLNNLVGWAHTTGAIKLQSDGTPGGRSCTSGTSRPRDDRAAPRAGGDGCRRGVQHRLGGANYRIRDLADVVRDVMPECEVTFAEGAGADPRSYRVDFGKVERAFTDLTFEWTARARGGRARRRVPRSWTDARGLRR